MHRLSYGNVLSFGKYTFDFLFGKRLTASPEAVRWL